MSKKAKEIPVNPLAKEFKMGIAIGKITDDALQALNETEHSHRHDFHIFLLIEKGNVQIEIDFEQHQIKAPAILYIHPYQVHRIVKTTNPNFHLLAMTDENLSPDHLKTLEQVILPAKSLPLELEVLTILIQTISLCTKIFERKNAKLYTALVKDYCNAFVGSVISQYLEEITPIGKPSRFDIITKEFKSLLEGHFTSKKRPSAYANALSISTPYLNECVRNATGFSVSHHIQQRVILEAKRLLYYSDKSIKEIANELGYNDYAYFSRLFTKATGMTALAFRKKNLG